MVGELGPRVHALQLGNKGMESKQYCNKFNTELKKKKRIFLHALIPALSFFLSFPFKNHRLPTETSTGSKAFSVGLE